MTLNESLDFSKAPAKVKKAFLGVPDKILLRSGTKLYKFTDYPLVNPSGGISEWWSFVVKTKLPSGLIAEGFRGSETAANRLGISHREYQKVRSAVSEQFNNNLHNSLLIVLMQDVWGFAGITAGQPEFKNPAYANVYLIGGKGQLWIPGLTSSQVQELPSMA